MFCVVISQVLYPWFLVNYKFSLLYHVPYLVKHIFFTFDMSRLVVLFSIVYYDELSVLIIVFVWGCHIFSNAVWSTAALFSLKNRPSAYYSYDNDMTFVYNIEDCVD